MFFIPFIFIRISFSHFFPPPTPLFSSIFGNFNWLDLFYNLLNIIFEVLLYSYEFFEKSFGEKDREHLNWMNALHFTMLQISPILSIVKLWNHYYLNMMELYKWYVIYMYMLQGRRYNISMMVLRVLCVSSVDLFGNEIKDDSNLRFAVLEVILKIMSVWI